MTRQNSRSQIIIPGAENTGILPGQTEFVNHIHQGLLLVIKSSRYLKRNDLWRANAVFNNDLRVNLLVLLEWEALTTNPDKDIWYDGRFIDQWGNPEVVSMFPHIFSGYQENNQRSGLEQFLQVYYRLALKIAEKLDLHFPDKGFKRVLTYLSEFEKGFKA